MGLESLNTKATKILGTAVIVGGLASVASAFFNDGIAGCIEIDGRAHFHMDDGSVTAEPVRGLQFDYENDRCIVPHGGGQAPDVYPRVDVAGSDYAEQLVAEAQDFSDAEWAMNELIQNPYETIEAYMNHEGIKFFDESGDQVQAPLAFAFSEALTSASRGTPEHPVVDAEIATGSVIVAFETPEGIRVGRVPAHQL